jgi:hypothetical protein
MASVPKTNRCLPASEAVVDPSQARTSLGHAVDLKLGRRISLGIECRRVVRPARCQADHRCWRSTNCPASQAPLRILGQQRTLLLIATKEFDLPKSGK